MYIRDKATWVTGYEVTDVKTKALHYRVDIGGFKDGYVGGSIGHLFDGESAPVCGEVEGLAAHGARGVSLAVALPALDAFQMKFVAAGELAEACRGDHRPQTHGALRASMKPATSVVPTWFAFANLP